MSRVLIVQFAGDYREADRLRRDEGREIYYGHGYVLDEMVRLRARHGELAFLCCLAPAYQERLTSGVEVIGTDANPYRDAAPVLAAIERFEPTHLVVQGPMLPLIRWGIRRKISTAVVLADSFASHPLYRWWRFGRLAGLLNDPGVTLVANHGANAARALVALGVRPDRVLAWDYPHVRTPDQFTPKLAPRSGPCQLLYVGSIEPKKGVGDVIEAIALLNGQLDVRLDIAGKGQSERFQSLAAQRGVADRIRFLGLVPNDNIPALMHDADAVIVPSRHEFPEGLPLTLYEALASRTPVIASDHPMFAGHLRSGESALIFPASRPQALADSILTLMRDPDLYARISAGSAKAWLHMQNPVKWGEMLDRWITGGKEDRAWLSAHSLSQSGN